MLWALVHPEPAGPCTTTFRGLVTEGFSQLERDPVCGRIYDVCMGSPRCKYEMRDQVRHRAPRAPCAML